MGSSNENTLAASTSNETDAATVGTPTRGHSNQQTTTKDNEEGNTVQPRGRSKTRDQRTYFVEASMTDKISSNFQSRSPDVEENYEVRAEFFGRASLVVGGARFDFDHGGMFQMKNQFANGNLECNYEYRSQLLAHPSAIIRQKTKTSDFAEANVEDFLEDEGGEQDKTLNSNISAKRIVLARSRNSAFTRARSESLNSRQEKSTGETRFKDDFISKETLVRNGYAFQVQEREIIIDHNLTDREITNLLSYDANLTRTYDDVAQNGYHPKGKKSLTLNLLQPSASKNQHKSFLKDEPGLSGKFHNTSESQCPSPDPSVPRSPRAASPSVRAFDSRSPQLSPQRIPENFEEDEEVDGWLLGTKYERSTVDRNGVTTTEREYKDVGIENSKSPAGLKPKHVVHVLRQYGRGTAWVDAADKDDYYPSFMGVKVIVNSTYLIELFKRMSTYYPEQSLDEEVVTVIEPHRFLYHHYQEICNYVSDMSNDETTRRHAQVLKLCLEKLDTDEPSIIQTMETSLNKATSPRTIPFDLVWLVYKPGTIVLHRIPDSFGTRAYVVHSLSGHDKTGRGSATRSTLWIECWCIIYNEHGYFNRRMESFPIVPFLGAINVENLYMVPLQYHPDKEQLTKKLVERGRKYWALKGRNFMEYSSGSTSLGDSSTTRVMIDRAAYIAQQKRTGETAVTQEAQQIGDNSIAWNVSRNGGMPLIEDQDTGDDSAELQHYSRLVSEMGNTSPQQERAKYNKTLYQQCGYIHEDDDPTDEQLKLCSAYVMGYSFREKNWGWYVVDKLYNVEFKKTAFEKLVMNAYYKDIVRAIVAKHVEEDANQFRDLVDGKGQGVVILLHGPPGVGKTLTAECIADLYERPLIAITSGDIGTNPNVLEAKLEEVFRRAEEWGAVLLLDEADVFLAERNLESLERNALVSIFLRTLEYFNGILFLTTNRIGTIDEAFQSRLHISIGLSALSVSDRKEVWFNFLAGLKQLSKDARKTLIKKSRSSWANQPMNGRQIRNCVRTALVLARQEGVPVNETHFEKVIQLGNDYSKYLTTLKKMDMENLAEAMGTRLKVFEKDGDKGKSVATKPISGAVRGVREVIEQGNDDDELNESDMDFHM